MRLKNLTLGFGAQVFKSLSDVSRLRILFLLYNKQEMCITDIELILEFTQTKTSRHLTYLKNAGLVSSRKVEKWVFYQIKEDVKGMLSQMLKFFSKDKTLQKDLETFDILFSNRELSVNKLHLKLYRPENV